MSAPRTDGHSAVHPGRSKGLGVIALGLAILTALFVLGTLGLAAVLYAPIARATSISAGEGPSLSITQEHTSALVMNIKSVAVTGAVLLGLTTLPFGVVAIGLDSGRRLGVAALVTIAVAALIAVLLLFEAFPIDPCLARITCG